MEMSQNNTSVCPSVENSGATNHSSDISLKEAKLCITPRDFSASSGAEELHQLSRSFVVRIIDL